MSLNKKQLNRSASAVSTVVYAALFVAAALFVVWKCKYGIGNFDEPFYLTVPYRLYQGDSLFANEWHLSQMTGFLLLPVMKLYMALFKSTDGIILNFRYIFVAVQGITSLLVFKKLKKYSNIGAIIASIVFFLYAPYNINALSYNTLGIIFITLSTLLLLTEKDGAKRSILLVLAGICFAAAVLCCPYLVFVYVLYTVIVFVLAIFGKKNPEYKKDDSLFYIKSWFFLSCGAGILAIVFFAFVLSRASLKSIIDSFPRIFKDPEHQELGFIKKMLKYIYYIIFSGAKSVVIYILVLIGLIITLFDKSREKRRALYIIIFSLLTIALLISVFLYNPYINFIMFPINVLALECAIISWKDEKIRKIFLVSWVIGIAYSVCCHFTSNVGYYAIASATSVSFIGSVVIILLTLQKDIKGISKWSKRSACVSIALVFIVQAGFEVYFRYKNVFPEPGGIYTQTELATEGPGKGAYTTVSQKSEYDNIMKIKKQITEEYGNDKSILFLSKVTWYYLAFEDYRNSSYSAWLSGVNELTFERLKEYYKINPEKIPDLIFIDRDNADYIKDFKKEYTFDEEVFDNGSVLMTNFKEK